MLKFSLFLYRINVTFDLRTVYLEKIKYCKLKVGGCGFGGAQKD